MRVDLEGTRCVSGWGRKPSGGACAVRFTFPGGTLVCVCVCVSTGKGVEATQQAADIAHLRGWSGRQKRILHKSSYSCSLIPQTQNFRKYEQDKVGGAQSHSLRNSPQANGAYLFSHLNKKVATFVML